MSLYSGMCSGKGDGNGKNNNTRTVTALNMVRAFIYTL